MSEAFDPFNLDSRSSLNSTRLAAGPGIEVEVRGRRALELLSQDALAAAVRTRAPDLRLDPAASNTTLLRDLDRCLSADDPGVREEAQGVAIRFGRYLGFLILTLTSYTDTSLPVHRHWADVRDVWLGGGIASGQLGRAMCETAREVLSEAGNPVRLHIAAFPDLLPLIGAARSVQPEAATALVFDFGGSSAKRALASYEAGKLTHLQLLSPVGTPQMPRNILSSEEERALGLQLAGFLHDVISNDLVATRRTGIVVSDEICVSIASYLRDNHPLDYAAAGYMAIRHSGPNAGDALSREISQTAGRAIRLKLIHDGTAAGRALAGERADSVVMLGTWLGLGFVPGPEDLRALHPDLRVSSPGLP